MGTEPSDLADQEGFTLVEVLVALAIAGVAFTLAFQIFSGAALLAAADLRQEEAVRVLDSELARVGRDIPLADGTVHGATLDNYLWQIDITDQDDDQQPTLEHETLKQLTVTVTVTVVWIIGRQRHQAHLVTLRLAPKV